jgi:hypothetical protein
MRSTLTLFCLLLTCSLYAQSSYPTVFETSGGTQTATYAQIIAWYEQVAVAYPQVQMREMGLTDSGLPLHLVVLAADGDFDLEKARKKGRNILLINNGIHPGEPDGIEASMLLLRDLLTNKSKKGLWENTVVAIVPVYNIGGAINRNTGTRVNQAGPESYGFRGNAQNYDLNRDFIKADTRNAWAFYEIFHLVQPDLFIDTHTSNGADYQYAITHLATQPDKLGGKLGQYLQHEFLPALEKAMAQRKEEVIPYVNAFSTTPDQGYSGFLDNPHYSTGYTTLFHTLGLMIETHMLKPFDRRVRATQHFLEVSLEILARDGKLLRGWRQKAGVEAPIGNRHPVEWKHDRSVATPLLFKGYEASQIKSEVSGLSRLYYDRSKPFTREITYYNKFVPKTEVVVPQAYIIPQGWHRVIERLKANGIQMHSLNTDTVMRVEAYRIEKYATSNSPVEGHYPHSNVEITRTVKEVFFRKGDMWVPVGQAGWRYLVEVLEPQATDSFFNWNFFDTVLQQKEGFSAYVFEDLATQLLEKDTELKNALEMERKNNPGFSQNPYAQLDFIYKRSPYYEPAHLAYPVYRLLP